MTTRAEITNEVETDLAKTPKHLLTDVHEELLNDNPSPEKLIHAQKRLASLFVALYQKSEESTKETMKLNRRLLYLTWAIAILTAVLLFIEIFDVPKITIFKTQATNHIDQNKSNHPTQNYVYMKDNKSVANAPESKIKRK